MKHTIFVVDDHPIMRQGYRFLINREADLELCGECGSAEEALNAIPQAAPDLAIVDITLKDMNGITLTERLKASHPELPVLIVSMHDESVFGERALRAGARGYIMKDEVDTTVIEAIRCLLAGRFYMSEKLNNRLLAHYMGHPLAQDLSPLEHLTPREFEAFEYIGNGLSTQEIADAMGISPKTIETHRGHIKTKLSITSNAKLYRQAVRWVEGKILQ